MRRFLIILLCFILVLGSVSVCFADSNLIDFPTDYLIGKTITFNDVLDFSLFSSTTDFYVNCDLLNYYHNPISITHIVINKPYGYTLYYKVSTGEMLEAFTHYSSPRWYNQDIRTVSFNGGDDINNQLFINWVYNNSNLPLPPTNTIFDSLKDIFDFATSTITTIGNSVLNNIILLIPCVCGIAFVGVLLLKRFLFIGI